MKFSYNEGVFEFNTKVLEVIKRGESTFLQLENSYFFPSSGGQLPDEGKIGRDLVEDVILDGNRILHEVSGEEYYFPGMTVKAIIDKEARMENSRNHTGQHLFSSLLESLFSIKTLSFSMGYEYNSIDTDKPLNGEMVEELTYIVNDHILYGHQVEKLYTHSDELEKLGLNKMIETKGAIQLIKIGNLDTQACCGTHVSNTRDLKFFIIKKVENFRGGSRVYFLFGRKAQNNVADIIRYFENIRVKFGVHETEVPFQVGMLMEREEEERKKVIEIRSKLAELMLNTDAFNEPFIYEILDEEEELIKLLVVQLIEKKRDGLILDKREERLYGFTGRENINLGKIFKENKTSKIRGGGGKNSFQAVSDEGVDLLLFSEEFKKIFEKELI